MNIISRTMNMKYSLCLRVFYTLKYSRRVSLEVFDFKPGAVQIVREVMQFLENLEKKL